MTPRVVIEILWRRKIVVSLSQVTTETIDQDTRSGWWWPWRERQRIWKNWKSRRTCCWTFFCEKKRQSQKTDPKLNWENRLLNFWSSAHSSIWLCVVCVTFFMCAGPFVRGIDWLACSSSLCMCGCGVDCLCDLRDVCVRSFVWCSRLRSRLLSVTWIEIWRSVRSQNELGLMSDDPSSSYFTEGVCSDLCPRFVPRSRCANVALVSSLQNVVTRLVYCKVILQGVLLFVNFWSSSEARLHRRWRVSSE